jgi:hypothetical protein
MKRRLFALIAIAAALGFLPGNPAPAEANSCMGVPPICMYPSHPLCICQNFGINCYWVCAQ